MTTIGVSVPVPDPTGRTLQDYRVELGDAAGSAIATHITLVPPVEVDEREIDAVCEHLARAAQQQQPFTVLLRGTGTFRPVSPVVFVDVVAGISECELLAAGVRRGPLAGEPEFPYHPHVTVAHLDDEAALDRAFDELAGFEARFEVRAFWLSTYAEDGWTPRHEFVLGGS